MKKRLLRLSKRILILSLCTCLVSGSVIQKYKITANATAIAASLSAYGAYEICLYLGTALLTTCGIGVAIENRDEIAELGKNLVDSMNFDEVSDWMLTKVNTAGQSYVYGSEALQEVQDMTFTVIQGGGNKPENDDDNDNDGDIDADDRTVELKNLGLWATSSFANLLCEQVQPILDKVQAGEINPVSQGLNIPAEAISEAIYYDGQLKPNSSGIYEYKAVSYGYEDGVYTKTFLTCNSSERFAGYMNYNNHGGRLEKWGARASSEVYRLTDSGWSFWFSGSGSDISAQLGYCANYPIFATSEEAHNYFQSGTVSNILNYPKTYQIADWLQETWISALTQLNTGIRSLNDNMLIVGEAANQALINQSNGLGYIEDLGTRIATTAPLGLPDTIADPIYYPDDSNVPKLAPEELPWKTPAGAPGTAPDDGGSGSSDGSVSEDDIRGHDPFGINTLFGILVLLIMILLMLLIIFLSCLAFIIMIFRIEPTTGFLPPEMVQGFEYLKTLEIPGFGMSVYEFFMALIYIILIFTVVGILRKNIDKIRFPRKGRLK